ncbi:pimeloyl-ACP methyl ester carboxylesterase [Gillisia mitskevichiae]|uniref:Pimeloyl-ACP methyl ester carboxylesterase n=1 Tax=Gillisia mitskevichiae TaxID=270921 RepID=A0A495PZN3_9FLAO|nr:alpha/beta fold hydrolase [Gillisia mitskevichiae]RKS55980.1 pimeloyl-ACP methyl ester carboxylesterase [Gillisia mitskevichiae]
MIKLNATVIGEGTPFLILHGFLGMSDNWKTLGSKFADKGFQVHLLDQRNHGRSPHTSEMNYQAMSQDIKDYCEENDLTNIILLGHSMGGKVAMQVAGDFPDLLQKLLIVDIAPKYYAPHHHEILEGLKALDNEVIKSRGDAEDFLANFIPDKGTRLFLLKNLYWKTKEKLSLRLNLDVLSESGEEIGLALPDNIIFIKPTLFIRGGKSGYISKEDEPLIYRHFPNARIQTIEGAGHWVHAEKISEFFKIVVDFI